MSEINCHGDEVIYSEVIPGWCLIQLVNLAVNRTDLPIEDRTKEFIINGNVMGEGNFGLTFINDPTFIFSMPPMLEPCRGRSIRKYEKFSDEEKLYYKTLEHYNKRLSCPVAKGYKFYSACLKAGIYSEHPEGYETLGEWLMPKIYHSWKKGKVMTYPYPNKDGIIHQPNLLEQIE